MRFRRSDRALPAPVAPSEGSDCFMLEAGEAADLDQPAGDEATLRLALDDTASHDPAEENCGRGAFVQAAPNAATGGRQCRP